ncbi:NADH dehydrogenase (ubiquinone) complex I, assembly factor 6-like [Ornithodoros turicata]|uniref:NADH dehydrogenase (ubiquinone) complex I, assembly factor 6-like n=1 Tax=Ornithodoros turicata TaxID=34597 RepID=UPI0031393F3B
MNARAFKTFMRHKYYRILFTNERRYKFTQVTPQSNAHYCMDILKKYDYENFLCCLLLPKDIRRSAISIRAFNVELSQIRDLVSKPEIGRMRIQFWRDALENIYNESPPQQPVAMELALAVQSKRLSKHWLNRMIDSREDLITDRPHTTLQNAEDYAERSISSTLYLILQASGIQDVQCDHVASHVGRLQGLTNLIRGVPFNASRGRVYLPIETMAKHKVSQEAVAQGKGDVKEVIYEIASAAHQHLETARSLQHKVPLSLRTVFLPAVSSDKYLQRLRLADFNVFDARLQQRNHTLPLALWTHKFFKRY